ncbi:hypothetical protein BC827DRAFT_1217619, partial [Russula dissimulans]
MAVRPIVQRSHLEPSHAPRFRRHLPRTEVSLWAKSDFTFNFCTCLLIHDYIQFIDDQIPSKPG